MSKEEWNFHEARIDLICYILNKGAEYLEQIEKRNAYDKIIRNYHQSNSEGEQVYKNRERGMKHLVHSKEALKLIEKRRWREASKNLHYEHSVPVNLIRKKLKALALNKAPNITKNDIRELMDCTSLVVITKKERDLLDNNPIVGTQLKENMPTSNWPPEDIFARFKHSEVNIELEDNYEDKTL